MKQALCAAAVLGASTTAAQADLVVSRAPTRNVVCQQFECHAIAPHAVLNVDQLKAMLKDGPDPVINAGGIARNIVVDAALTWAKPRVLTLKAPKTVTVNTSLTVAGQGGIGIVAAAFAMGPGARIDFWDAKSSLGIMGQSYALVNDIPALAAAMKNNPAGSYALIRDYDAAADGTYADTSPIPTAFTGHFEGLGHTISNLTMTSGSEQHAAWSIGLFARIESSASVADIALVNVAMTGTDEGAMLYSAGPLAGTNNGLVARASASGSIQLPNSANEFAGGLVGANAGTIVASHETTDVSIAGYAGWAGGITAYNLGTVSQSYSQGTVTAGPNNFTPGGLAGVNMGIVKDCYSLATVVQLGTGRNRDGYYGGLTGYNDATGAISSSYAAGDIQGARQIRSHKGGVAGYAEGQTTGFRDVYWDLDTGMSDPHQGVGNVQDHPGVTGLTTAQLQSALPPGFDAALWGQSAAINSGLPYLIANPPR